MVAGLLVLAVVLCPSLALATDDLNELRRHKTEILELLRGAEAFLQKESAIPRVPRDRALPTSFAQQRFWILEQLGVDRLDLRDDRLAELHLVPRIDLDAPQSTADRGREDEDVDDARLALVAHRQLERAGLDLVWVAEAYSYDAVSLIGYLAAKTETVEIGTGMASNPLPFRRSAPSKTRS